MICKIDYLIHLVFVIVLMDIMKLQVKFVNNVILDAKNVYLMNV